MSSSDTAKETVEYNAAFLEAWNEFCDTKGYVKRQAAHACRIAFMRMNAEWRESMMQGTMKAVFGEGKAEKGRKR